MNSKRKYSSQSTASLIKKARKYEKQRASVQPSLQRAVAAAVRKNVEKKGVDFPLFDGNPIIATTTSNASTLCLSLVQSGTGSWNRVGRKIQPLSLRLRGEIVWTLGKETTTSNYNGNTCRMVIVFDKQPSGNAIPTFDTVFGVTGQDGSETTTYLNQVRYDNMDRFSVLRDCVINFEPSVYNNAAGTQNLVVTRKPFDEYLTIKGKETVFLGQSVPMTIADISSGAIYVYFRAASNVNLQNQLQVSTDSTARLRYIDP